MRDLRLHDCGHFVLCLEYFNNGTVIPVCPPNYIRIAHELYLLSTYANAVSDAFA